jgi:7,8-dihydroneopterin aldolase/epimerase/oxygenase
MAMIVAHHRLPGQCPAHPRHGYHAAIGATRSSRHEKMPSEPGEEMQTPRDEILLEGMRFYAYHGVNPEERALGQRFAIDVGMAVDLRQAGRSDNLADTVSYSAVYKLVRRIVEGEPRQLIEAVAEAIASAILAEFPPVARVTVTVRKPEVPMKGSMLDAAAVRISRDRAAGRGGS